MAHPIFSNPPSRDTTAAEQRQRELDSQIKAFIAKGGEIQAFDTMRRPVESSPWSAYSITRPAPTPAPIPAPAAEPVPTLPEPRPVVLDALVVEPVRAAPQRRTKQPDDERLAVKIIVEAALGGTPRAIARNLQIPVARCQAIARQYHVQFHG